MDLMQEFMKTGVYEFLKGAAILSFVLGLVQFYFYPKVWFFLLMYMVNGFLLTVIARYSPLFNGLICIAGGKQINGKERK